MKLLRYVEKQPASPCVRIRTKAEREATTEHMDNQSRNTEESGNQRKGRGRTRRNCNHLTARVRTQQPPTGTAYEQTQDTTGDKTKTDPEHYRSRNAINRNQKTSRTRTPPEPPHNQRPTESTGPQSEPEPTRPESKHIQKQNTTRARTQAEAEHNNQKAKAKQSDNQNTTDIRPPETENNPAQFRKEPDAEIV